MKKRKTKIGTKTGRGSRFLLGIALFVLSLGMSACFPLKAQCPASNTAFLPGERVEYELYFNWKFVWVKAGEAVLSIQEDYWQSRPAYCINLQSVTSKKTDFFFKMRDTLTCYVTRQLEPLYFCKAAEEGKRHTVDEAWFAYKNSQSSVYQRRTWYKPQRPTQEMSYSDSRCIFDMLSIMVQARSWDSADYAVGDKIHFPMATGRKVEEQTLIYRGKENVEAKNDTTYRCLVFSFVEYDKNGKEEEVITFFISDDDNHLPIRLDMYLNFGSAKAFLRKAEGTRYPLASAIK